MPPNRVNCLRNAIAFETQLLWVDAMTAPKIDPAFAAYIREELKIS